MTAAVAPMRPPARGGRSLEVVLFAVAFMIAGLVVLALVWSGSAPYADLARESGATAFTFIAEDGSEATWDLATAVDVHRQWTVYVTGGTDEPPTFVAGIRFTDAEYSHMADVRRVFDVAKLLVPLSLVLIIVQLQRALARGSRDLWSLVRTGSLVAGGVVAIVGVIAVVAFELVFLAFHLVVFPQGNFLFDPAVSNLVRVYPDWYWEGIALRVGFSFVAVAIGLGALAWTRLLRVK